MSSLSREKLSQDEIDASLAALSGWEQRDHAIFKSYSFPSFLDAIAFIQAMAPIAEELDHHPELFNVYDRVEITLTTHDADGLTPYDFTLAKRLDALLD